MAITETWLKDHKNSELKISSYNLFRAARERKKNNRRGRLSGGAAAYVSDDIASSMETLMKFSNGVIEILGFFSPVENLFISVIYRQPDDIQGGHRSTLSASISPIWIRNSSGPITDPCGTSDRTFERSEQKPLTITR